MIPSAVFDAAEADYRQSSRCPLGHRRREARFLAWLGRRLPPAACAKSTASLSARVCACWKSAVQTGDLLAALRPSRALGIDFSGEMLKRGRQKHPEVEFIQADAHDLSSIQRAIRRHHPFRHRE